MTALRVACVGTGFIAGKHLAALRALGDVEVVAVADSVVERAQQAAQGWSARAYGDGLAMLEAEDLDAVWLCVPPFAHGALEDAALDRDLPMFVEKPLACDLATAERLAARLEQSGSLAAVGYHWRHLEVVEEARQLVAERPPVLVTGYWLDRTPPTPWWVDRTRSGGQVVEQTTHVLDLARLLVGEVDSVHAVEVGAGRAQDAGDPGDLGDLVPLASTATLRFASGAIGTVASARFLHGRHRVGLHLVGEGYAVELGERSLTEHSLTVATAEGTRSVTSLQDPVLAEDRAFVDAVRTGGEVRVSYADALRTHRLAWAAEQSARRGGPVEEVGHGG